MKIYVIRHGETDVNLENRINSLNEDDLNETGIKQARDVGKKIENIDYDFIISSPLIRTRHTAELLNVKNKKISFDNRLIERDAGVFTKQSLENIDSDDWWNLNPKEDYKDAETVKNVLNRIYEFLDELKKQYKEEKILIVTHGGVSKAISCYFNGIPDDGNLEKYKHNNCEIHEFNLN